MVLNYGIAVTVLVLLSQLTFLFICDFAAIISQNELVDYKTCGVDENNASKKRKGSLDSAMLSKNKKEI